MRRASKRAIYCMAFFVASMLSACAVAPQKTLVPEARLEQTLSVGRTNTEQALAALGAPALTVKFDSGYQAWLYQYAAPGAPAIGKDTTATAECLLLFDRDGIVRKIRRRPPE